jgi:hypothetical protein
LDGSGTSELGGEFMGDVIGLDGNPIPIENDELIADLCRFSEGILTEKQVRKRHQLAEKIWRRMGKDDALVEKIEAEKIRRIRDGSYKREKAQLHVVKAPDVLESIMSDVNANARHRIQSAEVLDRFAANGPGAAPPADRFQITIILNADRKSSDADADADVIHFDKSISINPNDEPNPQAVITKKDDDGE